MPHKNRNIKSEEYQDKYSHIPKDYQERLRWLYDTLHIDDKKAGKILEKRNEMLNSLRYEEIFIVLYEIPEGSPRPRFRIVNRYNLANSALSNPNFVHVYSITGAEDRNFMRRLITEEDFINIQGLIYTACDVEFTSFLPIPKSFNVEDTFLAELGIERPLNKPDWDNIGKKYSDMFNSNIWTDDTLVIDGTVRKFYSVLPRVEIRLKYLNMLYNRYQFSSMSKKLGQDIDYFGRKPT